MTSATRPYRWMVPLLAGCLLVWPMIAQAATKSEQLRRTMADIALMNHQLSQRKADAEAIQDALVAQWQGIEREVRGLIAEKGIPSVSAAAHTPRIWFDLMLIAELKAYVARYAQRIAYYRIAMDRLSYLYQEADDDLKIINTLADMKIDALIAQAEKIIDGYLADAQTLVIHPDALIVDPPETVWQALTSEK